MSGGGHPLEIPELVRIICDFLGVKGCTNLLYLSRRAYAAALPIAWKEVDFKSVLCLIPGMKVRRDDLNDPESSYIFDFPDTIDSIRFDIHSPFVKTLRTSGPYIINFPDKWPSSSPGISSRPLLPNLEHLVVDTFGPAENDHVKWIPKLLHPGLLGMEMFTVDPPNSRGQNDIHPWVEYNTSIDLINHISRTCPRLETLRIFPEGLLRFARGDGLDEAYAKIRNLQHLRSFTFSGTIVHEELLVVLGQLPHLETLKFCGDWVETWEYHDSVLDVPGESFVSLRHLHLNGLDEFTMDSVCNASPLFQHLVTAVIIFEDQRWDENRSDIARSKIAVQSLGQNSPHLENLTIHPRGDYAPFVASWPIINAFKYMPLRCLNLGEVYLDNYEEDEEDEEDDEDEDERGENEARGTSTRNRPVGPEWKDFLSAMPQLEELYLERAHPAPGELALFASHLPMLRLLVSDHVRLEDVKLPSNNAVRVGAATQPVTLRAHSYFRYQNPCSGNMISNAARFIFGVWPNATFEARNTQSDQQPVDQLNKAMESLRINHGQP
ncbi:hypothetical protein FS749_012250 [Ceratobasidium sp. UAMH 11750]|nr:hypothetical protein FS749_012250 [Ceratobasidium sp. UAMH 11750]